MANGNNMPMPSGDTPDVTPQAQNQAGTIVTRKGDGSESKAMAIETWLVQETINPVIQFSVDNSALGNTQQRLRIGSWAAQPDNYEKFDLQVGAADNAVITDQFGAGCKKVQGFSLLACSKPVYISQLKIITPAASQQLNQGVKYSSLQYDGTLDEINNNIAWTQQKVDNRDNLVTKKGNWILDAQQYLEYVILAGATPDIFINIKAAANIGFFRGVPQEV